MNDKFADDIFAVEVDEELAAKFVAEAKEVNEALAQVAAIRRQRMIDAGVDVDAEADLGWEPNTSLGLIV